MRTLDEILKQRKELLEKPKNKGGQAAQDIRDLTACELDIMLLDNPIELNPFNVPHVFKNKEMTIPATKELLLFLWACYRDDSDNLKYVFKRSQQYSQYGGAQKTTYGRWLAKFEKDLCDTWRNKYGNKV